MRRKLGLLCIFLGLALICGALGLWLYNDREAEQAQESVEQILPQLQAQIPPQPPEEVVLQQLIPAEFLDPEDLAMTEQVIDGYAYIGYLSIPSLGLDLPIMSGWDYSRLQIAPCRYTGTVREDNLVLMAHNYARHFGGLNQLNPGDSLYFTDMNGIVTVYRVVGRDVLAPTAVEEMTSGEFDLTLFTCTYGGKSRVTVYCDRAPER